MKKEEAIFESVKECVELIRHYRSNRTDEIKANTFLWASIHKSREIAQETFCGCGDERAYSIFYILSAACEMGKTLSELKEILKGYGIL